MSSKANNQAPAEEVKHEKHEKQGSSKHDRRDKEQEHRRRGRAREREESESEGSDEDDEDVIDLCDDHDYQVLSAVLETERGRNVAEILGKIQKDVHLLATSVHQLIQLSLAAQQARAADSDVSDEEEDD